MLVCYIHFLDFPLVISNSISSCTTSKDSLFKLSDCLTKLFDFRNFLAVQPIQNLIFFLQSGMKPLEQLYLNNLTELFSPNKLGKYKISHTWQISICFIRSWFLFCMSSTIAAFANAVCTVLSASSSAASFCFVKRSNALLSSWSFAI